MNKKIVEYIYIVGEIPGHDFINDVNNRIKEGYVPQGGIFIHAEQTMLQAMIKYEDENRIMPSDCPQFPSDEYFSFLLSLDLPVRNCNALKAQNIRSLDELLSYSKKDISNFNNFGRIGLRLLE